MAGDELPAGIQRRAYTRRDGSETESFSVRFVDDDGARRRRSFDSVDDALDFLAKRRSAKRWRPEELRQEQAGRRTLGDYFRTWWVDHAMVDLRRSTLKTYRCVWEAHAEPRLADIVIRDIDAPRIVRFRRDLLAAGVGPQSVVKTMSLLQRVFRDAVEEGAASFNPVKAVQKPPPGPGREVHPLTPLQIERLAQDLDLRGYEASAFLVRLMAYTGLRPQEALALHWYAVRPQTLLIEFANADGELDRLKNRKRSRKRSRSIDLVKPLREDLLARRRAMKNPSEEELVMPHETTGELWRDEHYRTWRRRIYVPSAENVGLPSTRPYDLRHTWASLLIAEKRLSIAELSEQLGDKTSTVLDTYGHVIHEWRRRRSVDIEKEIAKARASLR